ncbi:tryptophan 7-halogenase [Corallococcus sp. BB11-1]|uniref:tryptophan 7-halogenase n=1 Tax=Corallococcus sp. BB11-1 TaxID=2996783 RepID=UPI0010EA1284|nr:tryptophan 7-halogenase [Corallococcus sp. BB11-1]MCY1034271.1 tryptophan 7-halogenase [Corallococcus sp. BB11-1]RYZ45746.1 MAG: tryptophan halogenase [Myxococcaceae bacterium]
MSDTHCDVAVLGGGPAGAGVALALRAQTRLSVTLVERTTHDAPRIGETLPPDARLPLARLGVWGGFLRDGHLPSRGTASCWGSATVGYHDTLMSPFGSAWHLDRSRFDASLCAQVAERGGSVRTGTTVEGCEALGPEGFRLRLSHPVEGPTTLWVRFVVDATGWKAAFATSQGARRQVVDRCFALYGDFRLRQGAAFSTQALVESRPEGWWYSALLPGGRVVVGLMGDGESLRGVRGQETWLSLLARTTATRERLEACDFSGEPPRAVPAAVACLDRVHAEHWLAVGDAACAFDSLSSQGISKALGSALLAAESLEQHLRGRADALGAYAARVRQGFVEHLRTRDHYYREERRWPDAPFWRNRRKALASGALAA